MKIWGVLECQSRACGCDFTIRLARDDVIESRIDLGLAVGWFAERTMRALACVIVRRVDAQAGAGRAVGRGAGAGTRWGSVGRRALWASGIGRRET